MTVSDLFSVNYSVEAISKLHCFPTKEMDVMFSEMKKRMDIVRDASKTCEVRVFACLELVCFPISLFTILLVPFLLLNRLWWGFNIPCGVNVCIKVLLAAATGYITNYIAVEMLFKPYHVTKKHLLSILTLGYWSQGLVPRSKGKMGLQLGAEAETLIPPDKIANDLCKMVTTLLDDEKNLGSIENAVRNFLVDKEDAICATCLPAVETVCRNKVEEFVTEDRMRLFWDDIIKPKLLDEDIKEIIVKQFLNYVGIKIPELMPLMKEEVRGIVYDFLKRNEFFQTISAAAVFVGYDDAAKSLSDNIVDDAVDWRDVGNKICNRISDKQIQDRLKSEVENIVLKVEEWLRSDNGERQIQRITEYIRDKMVEYLTTWVRNDLKKLISGAIRSGGVWGYVRNKLIPETRPALELWLKGPGKDLVISKLDLARRIADAIDKLSVEEFHERVNVIAAQHLGAIQVLGYFLGAIVGVGLLVVG